MRHFSPLVTRKHNINPATDKFFILVENFTIDGDQSLWQRTI